MVSIVRAQDPRSNRGLELPQEDGENVFALAADNGIQTAARKLPAGTSAATADRRGCAPRQSANSRIAEIAPRAGSPSRYRPSSHEVVLAWRWQQIGVGENQPGGLRT